MPRKYALPNGSRPHPATEAHVLEGRSRETNRLVFSPCGSSAPINYRLRRRKLIPEAAREIQTRWAHFPGTNEYLRSHRLNKSQCTVYLCLNGDRCCSDMA